MLAFGLVDDGAENNNFELFSEGINCSWLLYWLVVSSIEEYHTGRNICEII
jgi:hypothetical protein